MKITIIYDIEAKGEGLEADWGFSCLIEDQKTPKVLFDTGASSSILLHLASKCDPYQCDKNKKKG